MRERAGVRLMGKQGRRQGGCIFAFTSHEMLMNNGSAAHI